MRTRHPPIPTNPAKSPTRSDRTGLGRCDLISRALTGLVGIGGSGFCLRRATTDGARVAVGVGGAVGTQILDDLDRVDPDRRSGESRRMWRSSPIVGHAATRIGCCPRMALVLQKIEQQRKRQARISWRRPDANTSTSILSRRARYPSPQISALLAEAPLNYSLEYCRAMQRVTRTTFRHG